MTWNSLPSFAAAIVSGALGLLVLLRRPRSAARWCFFAGMEVLAVQSALSGISLDASLPEKVVYWQTLAFVAESCLPGIWLCFSLTYSRRDWRLFPVRWRLLLAAAFLFPIVLSVGFRSELLHLLPEPDSGPVSWLSFGAAAKALNILLLIASVLILMNLEETFRAAVGTMRWRIKFLVLGIGVVFAARIYTESQALLFSGYDLALTRIEGGAR